jgi:hypothetical protein
MSDDVVENLKQPSQWLRIAFMLALAVALYVTGIILTLLIVAQVLFSLLTGRDNQNLREFGLDLTNYVQDILKFLTYSSEFRPFPFSPYSRQADDSDPHYSAPAEDISADNTAKASASADPAPSKPASRAASKKPTTKTSSPAQPKPKAPSKPRKPAAKKAPSADSGNNESPSG